MKEDDMEDALDALFTYHQPTKQQTEMYYAIRRDARTLVETIMNCCPAGPDRTAAIRKVREAVMTANASIATNNAAANLTR